jgi:hypothetical protein
MKTVFKSAFLVVAGAVCGLGQNAPSTFNTWLVAYQASTQGPPTTLPDGIQVIPSCLETMLIGSPTGFVDDDWQVTTIPITDPLSSAQQSTRLGLVDTFDEDDVSQVGIVNACIVTRNNVAIGTRKTYLRVEAFTAIALKGLFRCDMFDLSGNLLLSFNGTVIGSAVPDPDPPAAPFWNVVEHLPKPTP